MLPYRSRVLGSLVVLALLTASPARALPPGYALEAVRTGLPNPIGQIRFSPDGRLFYLETKTGRVMVSAAPFQTSSVWATLAIDTFGERGLLGMAFHPSFADSHYIYFYHTNPNPLVNRVDRLRDQVNVGVNPVVFYDGLPAGAEFHHGGRLGFGPDRMLYITFGEQTEPDDAQDPNNVRGKILRIGPGGKPAPGNPYGASNPAVLKGVRNPFGLTFDPRDGTGYFTENGPDCDDEVNILTFGANYGWSSTDPCGSQPAGTFPALASFTPTIAPTGCCLYRGTRYTPSLDGNLFFGSYNDGTLYRVVFVPGTVDQVALVEVFADLGESVLDVTTGADGLLWVATATKIWRILPPGVASVELPVARASLAAAPNPFTRGVALTLSGTESYDRLDVIDLAGRRVRSIVAGAATLFWDGRDEDGREAPAGVYLVRTRGTGTTLTRRVVKVGR
jgi:glucose/arabinose dehydrogenase